MFACGARSLCACVCMHVLSEHIPGTFCVHGILGLLESWSVGRDGEAIRVQHTVPAVGIWDQRGGAAGRGAIEGFEEEG